MESKSATICGHTVGYREGGRGMPVLMIHGLGPGTSIVGNFGPVLEPLSRTAHVFGMDLIGFGASDRRREPPYVDVDFWIDQALGLIELMPPGPVGIAGHSFGGALALKIAARSSRVSKVLTSSTVGAPYPINEALDGFWTIPADRAALRRSMARMVYSADAITDAMIEDRWSLLTAPGYAQYAGDVFAAPRQALLDAAVLSDAEAAAITAKIVMLHGRDDQPCPWAQTSLALVRKLPQADLHLYGRCGHNLPRERTAEYVAHATALFAA
jgi:2-hydroxymuconate-semialdehyde hydrolase